MTDHPLFGRPGKSPHYSKRHYEQMADLAREHNDPSLTDKLTSMFKSDNPRFDEDRFRRRATPESK